MPFIKKIYSHNSNNKIKINKILTLKEIKITNCNIQKLNYNNKFKLEILKVKIG